MKYNLFKMNIQAVKLDLIRKITLMENEAMIEAINHLLNSKEATSTTDWWDELNQAQRESIQTARQQMAAGKGIPHDDIQLAKENSAVSQVGNRDEVLALAGLLSDADAEEIIATVNNEFNNIEGEW